MREDFAELVPLCRGPDPRRSPGCRWRGSAPARGSCLAANGSGANLTALQRLIEPLAERLESHQPGRPGRVPSQGARGADRRRCSATSAGGSWASTTCSCRRTTRGCSTSSGRTSPRPSSHYALPPRDFRLWIAMHEVTHRVQFGAAPWLRGYLHGLVDMYLRHLARRPRAAATAAAEPRGGPLGGATGAAWAPSSCCSRPEQRELFVPDAGADVAAGGARVVRDERGGARTRSPTSTACAERCPPRRRLGHRAGVPEGDRLRAEGQAVRRAASGSSAT